MLPTNPPNANPAATAAPPPHRPGAPAALPRGVKAEREPFRRHPICLLLAIAFAIVVAFFPPTQFGELRGLGFIMYILSCAIVGLFVPLVLSFIAYWLFLRSSAAANITFGVTVVWVLGSMLFLHTDYGAAQWDAARARAGIKPLSSTTPGGKTTADGAPAAPATKAPPQVRVYHPGDQPARTGQRSSAPE